jgi:hypothetical protein
MSEPPGVRHPEQAAPVPEPAAVYVEQPQQEPQRPEPE